MPKKKPSLQDRFEQFEDDYLKFEDIDKPVHRRPDICAFLMLDALLPKWETGDLISAAEHDVIYLEVDMDHLKDAITDDQIRDLVRCGVSFDSENDGLMMYA